MQPSKTSSSLTLSGVSSQLGLFEYSNGILPNCKTQFKIFKRLFPWRVTSLAISVSLSVLLWTVCLKNVVAAPFVVSAVGLTQNANTALPHNPEMTVATGSAGVETPTPAPFIYATSAPSASTAATAYTITLIYSNVSNDYVRGINDSGQVVGYYFGYKDGEEFAGQGWLGFVWSKPNGIVYPPSTADGAIFSLAYAINNSGQIAGAVSSEFGPVEPVIWDTATGTYTLLSAFGGGQAMAVNATGAAAGETDSNPCGWSSTGSLLDNPSYFGSSGSFTGINDSLILCGTLNNYSGVGGTVVGVRYDANTGIQTRVLPQGLLSFGPTGINDSGDIVGDGQLPNFTSIAGYVDTDGTFHQVNTGTATAINSGNQIVGVDANVNPYVWTPSQGITNLQTTIGINSGWTLKTADAINNHGQIVGTGTYNGVSAMYLLTPTISETAFTLSPNQLSAAGSNVTATVTTTGPVQSVTITCQSGALNGVAAPTFNLVQSGNTWTGTFPTSFLKLAAFNPTTFIATATGLEGSTAVQSASLLVGSEPWLALSLNTDKLDVPAGNTFKLQGVIGDYTPSSARVSVSIPVPPHTTFVNSPDFVLNTTSNTLTWTGQLSAVNGSHTIAIEFQTNITTTPGTVIPLSATATAPGFQNITKSTLLLVGPAPTPVGIAIDDSGANGQATGSYTITSSAGASTLTATIAPVSYLQHSWLGVDEAYNAGGGPLSPTTNISLGTALADLGLVAPGASPTYCASFPNVGSQCEIRLKFTPQAALMNVANITLDLIGGYLGAGSPSPESLVTAYNALQTIEAFKDAESILVSPAPTAYGKTLQYAQVVKDIVDMNAEDIGRLAPIATTIFGKTIAQADLVKAVQHISVGEAILDIGLIVSDEIIFTSSLSGADANITYTATATAQQ